MSDISPIYRKESGYWVKKTAYKRLNGEWVLISNAVDPVAYLYNGVRLPKLPEHDKETYPYAFMFNSEANAFTWLSLSNAPLCATNLNDNHPLSLVWLATANVQYYRMVDTQWEYVSTFSFSAGQAELGNASLACWASYDVVNVDNNTIYLPASNPIPVYE